MSELVIFLSLELLKSISRLALLAIGILLTVWLDGARPLPKYQIKSSWLNAKSDLRVNKPSSKKNNTYTYRAPLGNFITIKNICYVGKMTICVCA
jgi:hypothetical protein